MKICLALVPIIAFSQTAFDVASVKPLKTVDTSRESVVVHPGNIAMRNVRLRTLIKWAYDTKEYQIVGPEFLGSPGWHGKNIDRYDVIAKTSENLPADRMKPMLQTLLAERFKLTIHRENREVAGYSLVVAKSAPELHPAKEDDPEEGSLGGGGTVINGINISMPEFADLLSGPMSKPTWDMTGLKGRYNFHINYASYLPQNVIPTDPDYMDALTTAMKDVIGLKLERSKRQVEMFIIDRVERIPTEN